MPVLKNPNHERAVHERLKPGATHASAYLAAGYGSSRRNAWAAASRLFNRPEVIARMAELQAEAVAQTIEHLGVSRAWVVERLRDNVERALTPQPELTREGKPTGRYRCDGAVANRALELLGKALGLFVERAEQVNRNYAISGEPLPVDEWVKRHVTPD